MTLITKYRGNFENFRKSKLVFLTDFSGLLASCLCFVHCWLLPLLLIFLPGVVLDNKMVHPVLCSVAIMSTAPLLLKKTFGRQSNLFKFALVLGNTMMLVVLFAHDHITGSGELVLNSVGGLSLIFVHYNNLGIKRKGECPGC